ncbi:ATP-dependent DNA helicase UvrD/PcrA [Halalkalibacter wakoensis JCM 9140]|uniref:ATP-dependent DNA helicase UvrD/PcrA n=1 Tax=Halalkalibacter wakoensis JCM 9140 TaxID=1236970 RepID=W4PZ52_9BACI|nr:UvrD-helicase domain-containing protein [Halalkalibacter wakoensis]GAE24404.1 ATP-dependent DNA helicase UvrD/PcrA [Halalkalibacter wakoensis JCM 9140]
MEEQKFIEYIERQLLPKGSSFTEEQKQVIFSEGSANIIAGPGSGKTTVLIAKFAYLLQVVTTGRGICIITHTNVAVDEIRTQLKRVGINNIVYPHFIGTIHEFFNYFFSYKAYQALFTEKTPALLEEDDYTERFKIKFEHYRTDNYRGRAPISKMKSSYLVFTQDNKITLMSDCHYSNERIVLNSLVDIISNGEIRHNDTLSLAKWYIEKHIEQIRLAFSSRFAWVILDEAQDTSIIQFDLLNQIINLNEINFQRYGDPYQSLYNMYDHNSIDAWVPYEEKGMFDSIELSNSTRFGNSIAKILKTTCIEEYSSFNGNPEVNSFKPHLLIYNDKSDVIPTYLSLVNELYSRNESFKRSKRKIAVVGSEHAHLKQYKQSYDKPQNVKIRTESIIRLLYNIIVKGFYSSLKSNRLTQQISLKDLKALLSSELIELKSNIALILKEVINNNGVYSDVNTELLIAVFNEVIKHFCPTETVELNYADMVALVTKESQSTFQTYTSSESSKKELISNEELFFGTVHAVKGETHKATLLIDSSITEFKFTPDEVTYNLVDLIFEYLTGDHIDYMSTGFDRGLQQATKKALKISYVALSRPTHLVCVAVEGKILGDNLKYIVDKSSKFGWEIKII